MKGMLKAELFKFTHSYSLWSIIGVIVGACSISIFTGIFINAEMTLANINQDCMIQLIACSVYGAIILTDDFSSGLLRHYISNGYNRTTIICAKFIHFIIGCSILLFVYPAICVTLTAVVQGTESSFAFVFKTTFLSFAKSLPLYLGILSIFFLISILIKKGIIAMGVSIASSILLVVFTNNLYGNLSNILQYSPIIQLNKISQNLTEEYFIAVTISLFILGLCLCGSIVKFRHDEI